jgi:hypothetical protein
MLGLIRLRAYESRQEIAQTHLDRRIIISTRP